MRQRTAGKDYFCAELDKIIDDIPNHDLVIVMGYINAQDRVSVNGNGRRVIGFCARNNLSVCNSFFKHKNILKKTWISPDDKK